MPNLSDTIPEVEAVLEREEAIYETARKALLTNWQAQRKHLRALLDVLKDRTEAKEGNDG